MVEIKSDTPSMMIMVYRSLISNSKRGRKLKLFELTKHEKDIRINQDIDHINHRENSHVV